MTTAQKELPTMGNDLLVAGKQPLEVIDTSPESILANAVASGRPLAELVPIMDLIERTQRSQAIAAYNAAVAKFQGLCPTVHKGRRMGEAGGGMSYQFADYSDVMAVAKPHLYACGLAISFSSEPADNGLKVTCRVSHGSHHEDHTLTVPVPSNLRVNDTQKYGAALSFAKRYCLTAALNIVCSSEDNDASGLCETISAGDCRALDQMLMESNSNIAAFCKAYSIEKVADLPASQLAQARAQILRKMEAAKR